MNNYDVMKQALEALESFDGVGDVVTWGKQWRLCFEAITALREALANQPTPPPECQTEAEKTAYAFGWYKALEHIRLKQTNQYSDIVSDGGMDPRK